MEISGAHGADAAELNSSAVFHFHHVKIRATLPLTPDHLTFPRKTNHMSFPNLRQALLILAGLLLPYGTAIYGGNLGDCPRLPGGGCGIVFKITP
jgi:hypothetical protein